MPESRVVLITGASMGLGHETAELLAGDGWTVFGTSREPENYSTEGWEMVELDVTDDASVRACVDGVMERTGRIDALVNNAGCGLRAMTEEATMDEVYAQFDTNYFGVHRMNRAVLPIMREQRSGRIVNISSLSGLIGTPPSGHYSATKHALEGYSQAMRFEVAQFGVRVSVVEPGFTKSQFRENLAEPAEPVAAYDEVRERVREMTERAEKNAASAIAVARTVRRVLRARNPRLRYTCTRMDWLAAHMRCWLPEGVMHSIVRKVFGV
ncbi:MAG: SDR family NAD(P)-dependent oxidoreductase [Armatimonadota bacterium]